jgi:uncharacterized sulfatase
MSAVACVNRFAVLVVAGILVAPSRGDEGRIGAPDVRPNVLFIVIDDLRAEIGCYGSTRVKTPNIDRLAATGMRFDRAYVQAAFCNPSRASFLTGLRPDTTRVLDNATWFRSALPNAVTLPQLFKNSGYHTVRIGKIFHGERSMDDPEGWHAALYPKGTERGRRGEGRNLTDGKVAWCRWMAAEGDDEDQADGQIAREAAAFLRGRRGTGTALPFFLAVGFHKPHDPFVAPARYFETYPLESLELHEDPEARTPDLPLAVPQMWKVEFDRFSALERREFLRAYYACTTFVDAQIGKVLRSLEECGLAETTVVLLVSDHGYHLGEHGWWNKNTLFELTARTPMIVRASRTRAKGKACSRLVEFIDIYPTLAELCGLSTPEGLAGRSFVPLLDAPELTWKEATFTQLMRGSVEGRTVRTERWRYTEWDGGRQGTELYDHGSDPGEYRNVAGEPRNAGTLARLKALLRGGAHEPVRRSPSPRNGENDREPE